MIQILMISAFIFALLAAFSVRTFYNINWGWLAIATWLLALILPGLLGMNILILLGIVIIILLVIIFLKRS